jgi:hypothetical protein
MNNPYSNLTALPLEVYLSENMSINIWGETILMACSCLLEKPRNIQQVDSVYLIQKFRMKQISKSGKLRRRKIIERNSSNSNRSKNVMKQLRRRNDEHLIKKEEQSMKNFDTKMPYHFSNQPSFRRQITHIPIY